MKECPDTTQPVLKIEKPRVIWRQVADQIRNQILSGKLPPHTKLPSTAQIAENSATDVKTVHKALSILVKEGLLSRQPKVGTYVQEARKSLSPMGLYNSVGHITTASRQFHQLLNFQVQRAAHQRGIQTQSWYDQRPDSEQTTPPPEIKDALHAGKINSILFLSGSSARQDWLKKIPVPYSIMSKNYPNGVTFDTEDFLQKSLHALKSRGCKSVSLISNLPPKLVDGAFADLCGAYGLAWRPRHVVHYTPTEHGHLDHFGYHGFKQLWRSTPHPDSIVLYPDSTLPGLLIAALSAGVTIGRDLKLAAHRNKGMEFLCPFPADFITSDAEESAEALIDQAQAMMNGIDPTLRKVGFHLTPE